MRVKLIYRNYKPLHKAYESLLATPPKGVKYIVPGANKRIAKFYKIYKQIRYFSLTKGLIRIFERFFFLKKEKSERVDLYQYLNIIDENPPKDKPYIVDFEHVASLVSFTRDEKRTKKVKEFLKNQNCKSIDCWSKAAQKTLKLFMKEEYKNISNKVRVVYPALPEVNLKPNYSFVAKDSKILKILFVGNQAYLKGLEELLVAIKKINEQIDVKRLRLYIISEDAAKLVKEYNLDNVEWYKPQFTKNDILSKFFMPADIFIMPTKEDTFGMALLDSLACGTAVVSTRQFATPEIVEDGKDGILLNQDRPLLDTVLIHNKEQMDAITRSNIDHKLVDQLVKVINDILYDRIDMEKMGELGRLKFKDDNRFSVKLRNKKMLSIYSKALR